MSRLTTKAQCAEMRYDTQQSRDMLDDAMYRKEYSQQSRDMLALLDSYEEMVQAAREELGPTGHTQGCRVVLNDGRRECDCIGRQVRQYDGDARATIDAAMPKENQ